MTIPTTPFDVLGPLPSPGRLVIEASAGTGKTYTLAALVAREVIETGRTIDEMLVVTYTRAAAAELRDRIRARLVEALEVHRGQRDPADDAVLLHLAAVGSTDPDRNAERLENAVQNFDAATITTIHGFCQLALAMVGSAAGHDTDARLIEDTDELIEAVDSDLLVSAAMNGFIDPSQLPKLERMVRLTKVALSNPGIVVRPTEAEDGRTAMVAARLVRDAEQAVHDRLERAGALGYDGLLTRLRAIAGRADVRTTLRERFSLALVDEFQDTDPVQWDIFSTLFGTGGEDASALVLVGDPKQAIYGFRGGDVHTYLDARDAADVTATLATNFRSDPSLVRALDAVFTGRTFGHDDIAFASVASAADRVERPLHSRAGGAVPSIDIRCASHPTIDRTTRGDVDTSAAAWVIARDLAAHVATLLDIVEIETEQGRRHPLRPREIAVLIRTHAEGPAIQQALRDHGLASVINGGTSVTTSVAADHWRWLLHALALPANAPRARGAALSWFVGWNHEQIAASEAGDENELNRLQHRLLAWADTLEHRGIAVLARQLAAETGFGARLLARPGGERDLTDLEHLAELLHDLTQGRPTSPTGLIAILDDLARFDAEVDPDALKRRIEADGDLISIMTVHAAKGLEFDVVCCPGLWRSPHGGDVVFRDPQTNERCFDVGSGTDKWPSPKEATARRALATRDHRGEYRRLTYVALTRARHHLALWWAPASGSSNTGIKPMLFGESKPPGDHREIVPSIEAHLGAAGELISVSEIGPTFPERRATDARSRRVSDTAPAVGEQLDLFSAVEPGLVAADLGRSLDRSVGRWSFTAITREEHAQDPDDDSLGERGAEDEPIELDPDRVATAEVPLPLGEAGAGTAFGTLVHAVLEEIDFTATDLDAELHQALEQRRWLTDSIDTDSLVGGLRAAIETSLGPSFADMALRDLSPANRLDELDFEIPIGAGGLVSATSIGEVIVDHLDGDDPLRPWAAELAGGRIDVDIAGYLTGSIDGLFRIADGTGTPRFHVIDYKTNWLGQPGRALSLADYHPDALPDAMAHHHYPLQALLYTVASHRFLRWRMGDAYSPARLGAAGYLFLRGMIGPDAPTTAGAAYGVFAWSVPTSLITDLSDLLHAAEVRG